MLTVDLGAEFLTLHGHSFRPFQRSQLRIWGFYVDDDNSAKLPADKASAVLPKVLNYLAKHNVEYEVNGAADTALRRLADRQAEFEAIKKACEDFKDGTSALAGPRDFNRFCSRNIARKLKSHQKKAAYHLYISRNGANFSVPGSGKTSVVLTTFEKLRQEGEVNVLFVVGPPACFAPWIQEFENTFDLRPDARILAGGNIGERREEYYKGEGQLADLYLTTFQTLLNDQQEINSFLSQPAVRAFLVVDEAHYIKQLEGNWASAVLTVARQAVHRCVLTGTPMPKSFSDVYNLFDFLWPDNQVIDPASRIRIQSLEKDNDLEPAKDILHSKIGPLFYRVRKIDLRLKPAFFHEPDLVAMNPIEREIYEAIYGRIRSLSLNDGYEDLDVIDALKKARIIRLRQCASYARLVSTALSDVDEDIIGTNRGLFRKIAGYDQHETPAKLIYLTDLVQDYLREGQKVLIWATFVGTIELIQKHLRDRLNVSCRSIYGKTPTVRTTIEDELTREEIIEEFLDVESGLNILIANPAACAESISLHTTCHVAIYYDLSYNCAQYLQSLDRIHRVGGSEKITAHYRFLQYADSIDQDILLNVRRKADKMSQIIDADYGIYDSDMFADEDELAAYGRLFQ